MFASSASAPHAHPGHLGSHAHEPGSSPASAGAALVSVDGAHAFPLEGAHLAARAEGGMAFSTFRQRFRNPHAEALEEVYRRQRRARSLERALDPGGRSGTVRAVMGRLRAG